MFSPPGRSAGLPRRHAEAIGKLALGSYDHVAIEFSGNALGLQSDDLVFEKATGARSAALLANVSGSRLCLVEVGGKLGADLAEEGEIRHDGVCARLARRPVRPRDQAGSQAHACDALGE
jgi:hypothetical protein